MNRARKIGVTPEAVSAIAKKLGISEGDVAEALAGNLELPRAKDARGLALVVYGGTLQAVAAPPKTNRR